MSQIGVFIPCHGAEGAACVKQSIEAAHCYTGLRVVKLRTGPSVTARLSALELKASQLAAEEARASGVTGIERGETMSNTTDRYAIKWARDMAGELSPSNANSATFTRLANLAEKGAAGWLPIASAPETEDPMGKREIELLVSDPHEGITIAVRRLGWWYEVATDDRLFPTHWRPLPAPPGSDR